MVDIVKVKQIASEKIREGLCSSHGLERLWSFHAEIIDVFPTLVCSMVAEKLEGWLTILSKCLHLRDTFMNGTDLPGRVYSLWNFSCPFLAEDGSEWLNRLCVLFSNEKKLRTFVDDIVSTCCFVFTYELNGSEVSFTQVFKWLGKACCCISWRNISTVRGSSQPLPKSNPSCVTLKIWSRIQHMKVTFHSFVISCVYFKITHF